MKNSATRPGMILGAALAALLLTGGVLCTTEKARASSLDNDILDVKATVAPYAMVTANYPTTPINIGTFSGQANEELPTYYNSGPAGFTVETNHALNLHFNFDLNHEEIEDSSLIGLMQICTTEDGCYNENGQLGAPIWLTGSLDVDGGQIAKSTEGYSISLKAKTGENISSQAAGKYSGAISLTVSASSI